MGENAAGHITEEKGGAGADAGLGAGLGAKRAREGVEAVSEGEDEVTPKGSPGGGRMYRLYLYLIQFS